MKQNTLLLTTALLLSSTVAATAQDAETLFNNKCAACHAKTRPSDMSSLVAPPVMGVMRHVKMKYPTKDAAVAFMVDYVLEPSREKAVCMPQKIQRFGLMPSQKGNVTKSELETITAWMYDNFPPAGFKGGMGRGMGMGGMRGGR